MTVMMPVLRLEAAAQRATHITEFGVRSGKSTISLLLGLLDIWAGSSNPQSFSLVSYDVGLPLLPQDMFYSLARRGGGSWNFKQANTLELDTIDPTDLVFIDALHIYATALHELQLASNAGAKTILLHDTQQFWEDGECIREWKPGHGMPEKGPTCEDMALNLGLQLEDVEKGLGTALNDFLASEAGKNWSIARQMQIGMGLTILRRGTSG
eukprot:TRINITY_DN85363_c0_g1_i1.p1 TRINITY_DN85363_c0_g1~~TRINITY_DN85363_c0_g1_i1.p1  ORF type:complete len:246 (+),score=53.26 TRINITY_DN85363_c0_g1_i1:108-740(+)